MKKWEEFGRLLKRYRKEHKLTQEELRKELVRQGYKCNSKATISRWENGTRRPDREIVEVLGDLFGNREIFQRAARYWQENEPNHQDDILSIVKALLANGIESTICRHIREKDMIKENSITSGREFDVKVFDIPNIGSFTEWELSDKLGHNFAILQHNPKLINCFDEHLKTGYPQVIDKRIQEAIYKKPYELIEILRNITSQRYIKGNCQVCKGPNNISF